MATRLGVDVGGTFTDLIFYDDETGEITRRKGADDPVGAPDGRPAGRLGGADRRAARGRELLPARHDGRDQRAAGAHGRGGRAARRRAASATSSRSARRARRPLRPVLDGSAAARPPAAALPVSERIRCDGAIDTPIEADDVRAAAAVFASEGVESVAIVFLHAYANPVHELAAARGAAGGRLRGRDLAVAPGLGRVPRVRAHAPRPSSTPTCGRMVRLPGAARGRLRNAGFAGEA